MIRCHVGADGKAARRRRSAWLALAAGLLLLTGCALPAEPGLQVASAVASRRAPETAQPRITDNALIAADGASLPLRKWRPKSGVKAVILALHGFNDYSNAFAMPASLWAERGIACYAYDQRGFGGAPRRSFWAGSGQLASDAVTAMRLLRRIHPGRPIYLLGESMGGAVAILAMTGTDGVPPADADGVILSAPAVWGRETMEIWPRLALWAAARLFPAVTLTGRGLGVLPSDNMAMLKALARDPMVLKETRVDAIYGLVDLMDLALAAAPRLTAPTLLMYGAHDQVVPREPIAAFAATLPTDPDHRQRLAYYRRGYHLLLRDLDGAAVAGDVASWVLDRRAALPSHSDVIENARPWPPEPDPAGPIPAQAGPPAPPGLASSGARR
jgi:acylglycerol lipase